MPTKTAAKNGTGTATKKATAATEPPKNSPPPAEPIEIDDIGSEHIRVPIVGTMPLIVSRFSEKAKRQMLDAQTGNRQPKQNRDPQKEYEDAMYKFSDGRYGLPTTAFKQATVGAARFYGKNVTMKDLNQFLFFRGEVNAADRQSMVHIIGEPQQREDVVRLAGPSRSADLRYRPEFPEWSCTLDIIFVNSCISRRSVLSLLNAGGMGVGVGEWRPERKGDFGTFMIDPDKEIVVVG